MDISRRGLIDWYYSALLDFELLGSLDVATWCTGMLETLCFLMVVATLRDTREMATHT